MAEASDEAEFVVKVIGDFSHVDEGMQRRFGGESTFTVEGKGNVTVGGGGGGGGLNTSRMTDAMDRLTRAIENAGGGGGSSTSIGASAARARSPLGLSSEIAQGIAAGQAFEMNALMGGRKFFLPPHVSSLEGEGFGSMQSGGTDTTSPFGSTSTSPLEDDTTSNVRIQRRRNVMSRRAFRKQNASDSETFLGMDFGPMDSGATRDGRPDPLTSSPGVSGSASRRDAIIQRRKNNQNWRDDQAGRNDEWAKPEHDAEFNQGQVHGLREAMSTATGGRSMPWNHQLSYFGRFMAVEGLRTLTEFGAANRQGNINQAMAMGDQTSQAMAAVQYRNDIASSMPLGVGRLAQLIRDPSGSEELGVRLPIAQAQIREQASDTRTRQREGAQEIGREGDVMGNPIGARRQIAQIRADLARGVAAANLPAKAASDAENTEWQSKKDAIDRQFGIVKGSDDEMVEQANSLIQSSGPYSAAQMAVDAQHTKNLAAIGKTKAETVASLNYIAGRQTLDVQFGQEQRWQSLRVQERASALRATAFGVDRYSNQRQADAEEIVGGAQSAAREFHHQGDDRSAALANKIGQNQLQERQTALLNGLRPTGPGEGGYFGVPLAGASDDITKSLQQYQKAGKRLKMDPTGIEEPGMDRDTQGVHALIKEIGDGIQMIAQKLGYLVATD